MTKSAALIHHLPGKGVVFFRVSGNTYFVGGDTVAGRLLKRQHRPTVAVVDAIVAWGSSPDLSRIPPGWEVLEVDGFEPQGVH